MSGNGIIFIKQYYQHNEQLSYFLIYFGGIIGTILNRTKEHFLPHHLCHIHVLSSNRRFLLQWKRDGGHNVVSCCSCLSPVLVLVTVIMTLFLPWPLPMSHACTVWSKCPPSEGGCNKSLYAVKQAKQDLLVLCSVVKSLTWLLNSTFKSK